MFSKETVSIIFRLVNFFILSGLAVYVFRKYLLTPIKAKLEEKYSLFRNLENQHKNLIDQKGILEIEMEDQDKLFEILKQKIGIWDKACKQEQEARKKEVDKIKKYHIKRVASQNETLKQQNLLEKTIPIAISQTYNQLEKRFEKKEESQTYLGSIIEYMEHNEQ